MFLRCKDLILLQTYTTLLGEALIDQLPPFLNVGVDVTEDPAFSMYNLSLKGEWADNQRFCHKMRHQDSIIEPTHDTHETLEAQTRLNAKKQDNIFRAIMEGDS